MIEVTDATFDRDVLEARQPVVVDFWAPWCNPCKTVQRLFSELEGEHEHVLFARLNVDENAGTASRYGILSLPTAILFDHGEASGTVVGARPRRHYEKTWAPWLTHKDLPGR